MGQQLLICTFHALLFDLFPIQIFLGTPKIRKIHMAMCDKCSTWNCCAVCSVMQLSCSVSAVKTYIFFIVIMLGCREVHLNHKQGKKIFHAQCMDRTHNLQTGATLPAASSLVCYLHAPQWLPKKRQVKHTAVQYALYPNIYTFSHYVLLWHFTHILQVYLTGTGAIIWLLGQSYDCPRPSEATIKDMGW